MPDLVQLSALIPDGLAKLIALFALIGIAKITRMVAALDKRLALLVARLESRGVLPAGEAD